jgi:hypothetical protein
MPSPTFVVENVMLIRETRHQSQDASIGLRITEHQDLFMQFDPFNRGRFRAFNKEILTMIKDSRLWYQFAVMSKDAQEQFEKNKILDWGSEATWQPEQFIRQETVKRMTEVARSIVEAIDNVGYHNKRPGASHKSQAASIARSYEQSSHHSSQSRPRHRNPPAGVREERDEGYWYDPARGPDMVG